MIGTVLFTMAITFLGLWTYETPHPPSATSYYGDYGVLRKTSMHYGNYTDRGWHNFVKYNIRTINKRRIKNQKKDSVTVAT